MKIFFGGRDFAWQISAPVMDQAVRATDNALVVSSEPAGATPEKAASDFYVIVMDSSPVSLHVLQG